MTKSRKVGPLRVRPHIRDGEPTGRWFVDIPAKLASDGKRRRKLFETQRAALTVAQELKRRVHPITGCVLPQEAPPRFTLRQAAERWLQYQQSRVDTRKKRASSLEVNEYHLKALCPFFHDTALNCINEDRLNDYQKYRLNQGRKAPTINSEVATLCQLLRWAKKEGYIDTLPSVEHIPMDRLHPVIPTPQEVVRIIDKLPPRLQLLVQLMAETGCRPGEAKHLTWECVDEVTGAIEIRARDDWTPKTRQSERCIPLNPSLLALLQELPKTGRYVFPGKLPGKPIHNFRKALKTAVAEADIRRKGAAVHITPKTFRKAFATWQAERNVAESVLQRQMGHAKGSRVTKQHYIHHDDEAMRGAVFELPARRTK